MSATRSSSTRRQMLRPHPLALCLACALLTPTGAAVAVPRAEPTGAILVENCDDAGSGSLRAAVAAASSGALIDLSGLACDTITLTSGAIAVTAADLRLTGPGRKALSISGNDADRVFDHSGTGTLTLSGLTVTHGKSSGDGGCILTAGHLSLSDVAVNACTAAEAAVQNTRGGGAAVTGNATLTDVEFAGNVADGNLLVRGGGLAVNGTLLATRSRFVDNRAHSHNVSGGNLFGNITEGGGLRAGGDTQLIDSTISGNVAFSDSYEVFGGGIAVGTRGGANPLVTLDMDRTRVADNTAESQCGVCAPQGGGIWVRGGGSLSRVDVLDNQVTSPGHYGGGGGLRFTGTGVTVEMFDSTISGNRAASAGGGMIAPGQGTVSLERTQVTGNSAGNEGGTNEGGGGILSFGGAVKLTASSVTGNTAGADGGGLALLYMEYAPTDSTIVNSTISGNSSREGGGVMVSGGRLRVSNSTVAFNQATRRGAGISSDSYTDRVELTSTIVSANTTNGQANPVWLYPKAIAGSHNLIDNASGPGPMPADTITLDPLLQPLADNGGPTPTHALGKGSPAIDAGSNPGGLTGDQRGGDYVRAYGEGVDIGAFELQPPVVVDPKDRLFKDDFES